MQPFLGDYLVPCSNADSITQSNIWITDIHVQINNEEFEMTFRIKILGITLDRLSNGKLGGGDTIPYTFPRLISFL